jgi:hypothetical protein
VPEVPVRLVEQGIEWPAWISAGAAVATLVIVAVTAGFALAGLRDARRTRHAQLVIELSSRWDDPEIIRSASLAAEYTPAGIVALLERLYSPRPKQRGWRHRRKRERALAVYFNVFLYANLLESIGTLLEEEAISAKVIYRLWGAEIIGAWEDTFEEPVRFLRTKQQDQGIYRSFEELAGAMAPLHAARPRAETPGLNYHEEE